jgi:hypothetical protein
MFILGLLIGFGIGFALMGILRYYRAPDADECAGCRAAQRRVVSQLEDQIHGLKSTKGALAKEIQHLSFMNSGYRAR